MAFSDDNMLARFGMKNAKPFDWGDEPQMTIDNSFKSNHTACEDAPLSGLLSLQKFVQDKNNGDDAKEKNILESLLKDAQVDFSVPVSSGSGVTQNNVSSSSAKHRERMSNALMGDTSRDVSIKGLSDRAVAELCVESRTSLFGSILRLFDVPKDADKPAEVGSSISTAITMKKKDANTAVSTNITKDGAASTATTTSTTTANPAPAPPAAPKIIVTDPMIMKEPILSTAEIVRSVHLSARPGDVPAGMDSKEYTMAVLHFLSSYVPYLHENESAYRINFSKESQEGWDQLRRTCPVLPLIKAINPKDSLEQRMYGRVRPLVQVGRWDRKKCPDSMDLDQDFERKVLNLERMYSSSLPFSSPSSTVRLQAKISSLTNERSGNDLPFAFQRYVPRRKLVPHIEGGAKEELTLMISGHMQQPQHTPGPKKQPTKSKATAAPGSSAKTTAPSAVKSASPGLKSATAKSPVSAVVVAAASTGTTKPAVPNSTLTPAKRKAAAEAEALLQLSQKGKQFII